MTTPDPLATYLITGGISRVCEELAGLMRACHHAGCDGYQLPSAYDRCADSCSYPVEMGGLCRKCLNHMRYDPRLSWTAHSAPTSSPGEDNPEHCGTVWCQRLYGHTGACMSRPPNGERSIDECRREHSEANRLSDALAELERVRAENARLVEEAASWESACSVAMAHNDKLAADSERLVSELRTQLAESEQARIQVVHHNQELVRSLEELRAELGQTEAERLKLLKYYGHAPDSAESVNPEVMALKAELAKREAVVEAARAVYDRLNKHGRVESHGHREHPGGCAECHEVNALAATLSALEQPQAEPGREIVVGSTWCDRVMISIREVKRVEPGDAIVVEDTANHQVSVWGKVAFLERHSWRSDPPVSEWEG